MDRQPDNILEALEKSISDSLKKVSPSISEAAELFTKQVQGFMDQHDQEFESARRKVEASLKRGLKPRSRNVDPL